MTVPEPEQGPARRGGWVARAIAGHRVLVVTALVFAVAGFLWFRPDKLFVDASVDEARPSAIATGSPGGDAPDAIRTLSTGAFRSLEHETTGRASILALADGSRVLRFDDLRTSNGPDLIVMLSDTPATEDGWRAYDDGRVVTLGPLKGNIGDQNYAIPDDVDLSAYRSAVVWCRRFTVGFGAAPIMVTS